MNRQILQLFWNLKEALISHMRIYSGNWLQVKVVKWYEKKWNGHILMNIHTWQIMWQILTSDFICPVRQSRQEPFAKTWEIKRTKNVKLFTNNKSASNLVGWEFEVTRRSGFVSSPPFWAQLSILEQEPGMFNIYRGAWIFTNSEVGYYSMTKSLWAPSSWRLQFWLSSEL